MKNIEPATAKASRTRIARARMRARLPRFNFARSTVMFDTPEMIGLGVAVLLMLLAVFSYFYSLAPARERLRQVQAALDSEQELLRASGQGLQEGGAGQVTATEIITSLRNFEAEHLPLGSEGQIAVVEELNEFIRRNSLRPDGLSFTQIESDAALPARGAANGRAANVFPGLGLTVGVEGTYPNVRRFIHDIETSRQFLVINGVELEGVRNAEGGGGVNTLVSLNLNIAAYFRPTATPAGSIDDVAPQQSR